MEYLKFHAYDEDAKRISKTRGFMHEGEMVRHITVAMSRMEQGMHKTPKMDAHGTVPAMPIGCLATRRDYGRVGMGSCMGNRAGHKAFERHGAVMPNPKTGVGGLYAKLGLVHVSGKKHNAMFFDIKKRGND